MVAQAVLVARETAIPADLAQVGIQEVLEDTIGRMKNAVVQAHVVLVHDSSTASVNEEFTSAQAAKGVTPRRYAELGALADVTF